MAIRPASDVWTRRPDTLKRAAFGRDFSTEVAAGGAAKREDFGGHAMAIPAPKGDLAAEEFKQYLERGLEGANLHKGDEARKRLPSGSIAVFWVIVGLTITAMLFLALFTAGLWYQNAWLADPSLGGQEGHTQQMMSFWLGMFFVDFALIVDLYRKHFIEDVMLTRRRRPKFLPGEDSTKNWDSQWNKPKANRVDWYEERQRIRPTLKPRGEEQK